MYPLGMWRWLVSPQPYVPLPASGFLPQDILRDDPPPPRPNYLFRPDWGTFQRTLARLSGADSPWMRPIVQSLHFWSGIAWVVVLALIAALGTWDWHPAQGGKVVRALLAAAA